MKNLVDFYSKKKVIFKSFEKIDKNLLNTRKKIDIYIGTDINKNYHCMFIINQKSRFLIKDSESLMLLEGRLEVIQNHNFRYKHLLISKNICSKSVSLFEDRGWKLHYDFV